LKDSTIENADEQPKKYAFYGKRKCVGINADLSKTNGLIL